MPVHLILDSSRLYDIPEAALILGVPEIWLKRRVAMRMVPVVHFTQKLVRFTAAQLEEIVAFSVRPATVASSDTDDLEDEDGQDGALTPTAENASTLTLPAELSAEFALLRNVASVG